jgi:hypothetical protein
MLAWLDGGGTRPPIRAANGHDRTVRGTDPEHGWRDPVSRLKLVLPGHL